MNFVSRLKQVVLPAPFGPISAWMVPRATRRLTPFTATKPANSLVRFSVSRMKSSLTTPRPRLLATVVARPQQVQQNAWGSRPARSLAGNRGQAASRPDPFRAPPQGSRRPARHRGGAYAATLPQASPHYYVMARWPWRPPILLETARAAISRSTRFAPPRRRGRSRPQPATRDRADRRGLRGRPRL